MVEVGDDHTILSPFLHVWQFHNKVNKTKSGLNKNVCIESQVSACKVSELEISRLRINLRVSPVRYLAALPVPLAGKRVEAFILQTRSQVR